MCWHRLARVVWVLPLLLVVSSLVRAELQVVELQHRGVEEIRPLLQSLLQPGEALSGEGNRLLIQAPARRLPELLQAVEVLDVPRARLRISVRGAGERHSGVTVDRGSGTVSREISTRDRDVPKTVIVDDGELAVLSIERDRWQIRAVGRGWRGRAAVAGRREAESSGFWVRPRLVGQGVRLEFGAVDQQFQGADGRSGGGGLRTTISGSLGEWLQLGGQVAEPGPSGSVSTRREADSLVFEVLVESVDPVY